MTTHDHNQHPEESSEFCDELQPRIAAYALGEASDDAALLEHLQACPRCQRDLRAYAQLGRVLPYAAPAVAPPPALRERIVATVAAAAAPSHTAAPERKRRTSGWQLPAFGLALAAIIALLVWNVSLQQQNTVQTAQLANSREGWRITVALLNSPDVQSFALNDGAAPAHLWASQQQQVGCLVAENLPPLAEGQVFQVWLTSDGERVSGGTFEAPNGSAWILIHPDEPISNYQSVGVTVEPRGGSPAPTGPRVLFGSLAKT